MDSTASQTIITISECEFDQVITLEGVDTTTGFPSDVDILHKLIDPGFYPDAGGGAL